ncbi:MAG: ABC transporter substrate-binding protein [Thermoleophilia bacterium]
MSRLIRTLAALAVLALALGVAACGDDSDDAAATTSAAPGGTPVTVAVLPIIETAAVYVAQEKGLFAEQGLDVTITTANTSSAIIPGLVSGQYDIGFSNMVTFLLANNEGLGLTAIAAGSAPNPAGDEDMASVIATDPAIRTMADLKGKTVAVNALNNIAAVSLNESLRKAGVDPGDVKLVELGFGDQGAALADGQVDAAFTVEPFMAIATKDGAHVVGYPYLDVDPDLTIASYVMSDKTLAADPEVATKFAAAVRAAVGLIDSDRQVLLDAVSSFSDIDPKLLPGLVLCGFPTAINRESVANWGRLMVEDGLVERAPDVDPLIAEGA